MRRRSVLFAFVLVLALTIGPGAILADSTRPTYTPIGEDESLTLYGFTFQQFNEVPWDTYEATMTVYVLAGTFAFYGENQEVVINPPPGSDCLEIRNGVQQSDDFYLYEPPQDPEMCVQAGESNCTEKCILPHLDDPQAVILEAGSVLHLPAGTLCFICAIEAVSGGAALLDVTVRTEDAGSSWTRVSLEATPESGRVSNPIALRPGKLPLRNPGGCAGRV